MSSTKQINKAIKKMAKINKQLKPYPPTNKEVKAKMVKILADRLDQAKEVSVGKPTGGATSHGWHSIESMLRCAKEFQLQHVRKIRKPLHETPEAFAVGLLFHAGRARWFSRRFGTSAEDWTSVQEAVTAECEVQKLPVTMQAERRAMALLNEYCAHWATRPSPTPVAAEYSIGPSELFPGEITSKRTARLDDVSKYPEAGNLLCLGESKTTSTDINDTVNQYTLHGQPMLQAALWHVAPQGEALHGPIAGIILDVIKKPYGKDRCKFARQFVPITPYALTWFVNSLRGYLRAADLIKWDTDVPRNVSMCTRMIGRMRAPCPFRDLCIHGKSASSMFVLDNGHSLLSHKSGPGEEKMPWE